MTNVVERVWAIAEESPAAPAVADGDNRTDYRQLVGAAAVFAARMRDAGIGPGDRVVLAVRSSVAFAVAYCGLLAAGAVVVPVNPALTTREAEHILADADCALVVADGADAAAVVVTARLREVPVLAPERPGAAGAAVTPVERDDADLAVLLYTSGTTGRPKAAMLSHGNLAAATDGFRDTFDVTPADRLGTALPLFHVFGQVVVLGTALRVGASVTVQQRYDPDALLRMLVDERLTIVCGVPTMWIDLLDAGRRLEERPDVAALRLCNSGGAALPREVARAFEEFFGAALVEGYGLSETAAAAAFQRVGAANPEGSVGRAVPGVRLAVVDDAGRPVPAGAVGEITVSGAAVTAGYWRRPDSTAEAIVDGALRTGDLGRLDAEGNLWIVDRKKDLIIRGGHNIYPREVEEVLYEHSAVREAVVVGIPDERLGEEAVAVVSLVPGSAADAHELRAWLDLRLAAPKIPRLFSIVEELPKGPTGKLLKRAIDRSRLRETAVRTSSRIAR